MEVAEEVAAKEVDLYDSEKDCHPCVKSTIVCLHLHGGEQDCITDRGFRSDELMITHIASK